MKKSICSTIVLTLLMGCTPQPTATQPDPIKRVYPQQPTLTTASSRVPHDTPVPYVYTPNHDRIERSIKLFEYIDKNKDKIVTKQEYLAYCIERTLTRNNKFVTYYIEQHDKNGDGKLTVLEADKDNFNYLDLNHDHFLSAHELSVDMRAIHRRLNRIPTPTEEAVRANEIKSIKKEIRFCDTDSDGRISVKEGMNDRCDDMSRAEFDAYDIDKNGYITVEDMMTYNANQSRNIKVLDPYDDAPIEIRLQFAIGKCDVDLNSNLTIEEMTAPKCGFTKKDFIENDYDKDGHFTTEDLSYRKYLRAFTQANKNRDNGLSFEEYLKLTDKPY